MTIRTTPSYAPAFVRPTLWTALAVALTLGLSACGGGEEEAPQQPGVSTGPATPATTEPAPGAEPDATVAVTAETPAEIAKRADAAVDAQQLFAPPGDNAFELYLRVLEADANQPLARNALTDLFPYAVMHVEQRLKAADPDDAERVLLLMEKANPQAPSLPRLRTEVAEARQKAAAALAAEEQRAQREAAAQEAARQAAAQAAAQPAAPPPTQPSTPPRTTPTQPTTEPAAEPAAPVAQPTPPPAAPPRRPGSLPPVVSQVQPRYPSQALRRRLEGFVEVGFTVLADGSVTDVVVLSSEPRNTFDREALGAMRQWRFRPQPGAEPVKGKRTFDFKLSRE